MRLTLILVILLNTGFGIGQTVESKSFQKTVNKLLSHTVPEVGVSDVDTTKPMVYLDARELNEYQVSHIKNAIWVGYDNFQKDNIKNLDKNSKILVYCSVGYRSEKIAEKLLKMGFTDVSNLYGGLFEWSNRAMPMVCDSGTTQAIHAYDKNWGKWITNGKKVY
jgi:rhodanese-related sulfurtransferase